MSLQIRCFDVDCLNPRQLALFWRAALGWRLTFGSDDEYVLEPPEGSPQDGVAPDLLFLKVPEAKTVKNRLHLDLRPDDQDAEVERLLELGASRIDVGQGNPRWVVLADPEGNEFCVLSPLAHDPSAVSPDVVAGVAADHALADHAVVLKGDVTTVEPPECGPG